MTDEWQTLEQVRLLATAVSEWCRGGPVAGLALSPHADHGIHRMRRDSVLLAEVGRAARHPVPVIGPLAHPALLKAVVGLAGAVVAARPEEIDFAGHAGVPGVLGWIAGLGVWTEHDAVTGGAPSAPPVT